MSDQITVTTAKYKTGTSSLFTLTSNPHPLAAYTTVQTLLGTVFALGIAYVRQAW